MTVSTIEYQLRSSEATWNHARWELLPDDGNRYEVIDGVLFMTTAPSNQHQYILTRLMAHVGLPLEAAGIALFTLAPIGVIMPGCDPVQPDFLLMRSERAHHYTEAEHIHAVPDLIAEILSPSNPDHDLRTKRTAYARAGVPEYWIVRPDTRDVFVLTNPDPAASDFTDVRTFDYRDELVSPTLPLRVMVATLFDLPAATQTAAQDNQDVRPSSR